MRAANDTFGDPLFVVAAVLDPRIHYGFLKPKELKNIEKYYAYKEQTDKLIVEVAKKVGTDPLTSPPVHTDPTDQQVATPSGQSWRKCLDVTPHAKPKLKRNLDITGELAAYHSHVIQNGGSLTASCPLQFWKENSGRWPFLANLFRRIGSVPVTSAGAERVFSLAGYIMAPRRARLAASAVERSVMVKINKDL